MVSCRLPSSQVALRGMEMQCSLFFLLLRTSWGCSLSPWESVGCQGKMFTANAVITWVTAVNANWIEWGHGLQSCQYFSRILQPLLTQHTPFSRYVDYGCITHTQEAVVAVPGSPWLVSSGLGFHIFYFPCQTCVLKPSLI